MPGKGTAEAFEALIARMKTINGSPTYWTNLEERVANRLVLPEDRKIRMPYVCVVLSDDAITYPEDNEGTVVLQSFRARIFGFVVDKASRATQSSGPKAILDLHDDIVKAIMSDWTLDGTVDECRLESGNRVAGILTRYAEMELALEMRIYLSAEGLGPG